ncbi:hypothetical protein EAH89_18865 [Roseomonas nepalensis]|uniref:Peptidase S8/S53 domain-containing protein n=1 Tax=Muricoccus nepalensis TaxID=1854500 RepID=A0A502FRU4_9PROT|nr:S8 family serine peptidase [Roseomonas nepalensis]TPG52297.1 hypothetical protein EAH89_18865 [Roseomonas nepalensis]
MRLMVTLPNDHSLRRAYQASVLDRQSPSKRLESALRRIIDLSQEEFEIVSLPSLSNGFQPLKGFEREAIAGKQRATAALPVLVISIEAKSHSSVDKLLQAINAVPGASIAVDLPIGAFDAWCPSADTPSIFHTRDAALHLVRADSLLDHTPPLRGDGVNVVVVDLGLNRAALDQFLPTAQIAGAWEVEKPTVPLWTSVTQDRPFNGHGTMVARNVLSIAPNVRLFDFPLLPDRVTNVVGWTSWAFAALSQIKTDIETWLSVIYPGPWVFCNAWGIYDRREENLPADHPANYTSNPAHPLNQLVTSLASSGYDQVFAAGNGGQFCPHPLCGPNDTGPGNSIFGASSHADVLTVGCVRADGTWIGYSSQGPGQPAFRTPSQSFSDKPDLCAPSHFVESTDAAALSSGTSASCGLTVGAVAALRSQGSPCQTMSSPQLRSYLRETADKKFSDTPSFDLRYGYGILNLADAVSREKQEVNLPASKSSEIKSGTG